MHNVIGRALTSSSLQIASEPANRPCDITFRTSWVDYANGFALEGMKRPRGIDSSAVPANATSIVQFLNITMPRKKLTIV